VPPAQVALEVVVITLQLNAGLPQGIDLRTFNASGSSPGQTFAVAPVDADQASLATGGLPLTRAFGLKCGVLTGDPQAFITALETASPVRSARAWQMTVVNRQSAALMLDDPFGPGGSGAEFATGSLLKIRPVVERTGIDRTGTVRLDVRREMTLEGPASGSRSAALTNQIVLQAGQTAVLGGFYAEQTALQFYRRSGIGRLPLVGGLFLKQAEVVERYETIVLLTPRVIAPAAKADSQFVRKRPPVEKKAPAADATIHASHAVPASPADKPVRPQINPRPKP
jgi:type II secretory pathway component GspD/PulD (secretin)